MRQRARAAGRRFVESVAPTVMASLSNVPSLQRRVIKAERRAAAAERQVKALRDRVARLEAEVQEGRRLNRRVAEITDVVEEVLLPATNRDEERMQRALDKYASTL